jgi:hypothetical protein
MIPSSFVREGSSRAALRGELRDAMWLALVPIAVAVTLGVLLLPRDAIPDGVPLPIPDGRALLHTAAVDHELAERARGEPLPASVRALGSAIRTFHMLEAGAAAGTDTMAQARTALDSTAANALREGDDTVLRLRAIQLESFLKEVEHLDETGMQSVELASVAGNFVAAMQIEGWYDGRVVVASGGALRAMFKEMWNRLVGLEKNAAFAVPLDEERALYALYLSRPHPPASARAALDAARRGASDADACNALVEAERVAVETWRLDRISRLSAIDPSYPAQYARGLANLRRGEYVHAADDLGAWLHAHPDGPLALRARSYLRAAILAAQVP